MSVKLLKSCLFFGNCLLLTLIAQSSAAGVIPTAKPKVFFIASNAVIPRESLDGFYIGFETAFIAEFGLDQTRQILEKSFDLNNDPGSARRLAKEAVDAGAVAIAGVPSSHEALLIGDICKSNNVLCLSTGAHHTKIQEFGSTTHTIVRSLESAFLSIIEALSRSKPSTHGAIVVDDTAVFSLGNAELIEKVSTKFSNVTWDRVILNRDLKVNQDDLKRLSNYDAVFITIFPWGAENLLTQLGTQGVKVPVFATSSWDAKSYLMIKGPLSRLQTTMTIPVLWQMGSKEASEFERSIQKRLNHVTMTEMALGYDAGKLMAQAIKASPEFTRSEILNTIKKKEICADKTSVGKICLTKTGGYSTRKEIFAEMTGNTFRYLSPESILLKDR